jgi:lantibiotic biosynthesis protein
LAAGDSHRRTAAEHALAASLSDPRQLAMLTDAGLCHGTAGAYQTAWWANCDATTTALHRPIVTLATALTAHSEATCPSDDYGLLDGDAGVALTLQTLAHGTAPRSGWDICLLLI